MQFQRIKKRVITPGDNPFIYTIIENYIPIALASSQILSISSKDISFNERPC